jgi:hypothetical protein
MISSRGGEVVRRKMETQYIDELDELEMTYLKIKGHFALTTFHVRSIYKTLFLWHSCGLNELSGGREGNMDLRWRMC